MNQDCREPHQCQCHGAPAETSDAPTPGGVEHPGVIDLLKHDAATDRVLLVMGEPRPWDGSELQLFQLQEKFNAYLSFLLDGEFAETYPALVGKRMEIRLECMEMPEGTVAQMLDAIREQIAFQGITLTVVSAALPAPV